VLQGSGAGSIQAFVDGLIADGDRRGLPEAAGGEEAPDGEAGGSLAEGTDDERAPEEERREDTGTTRAVGVVDSGTKVSEEGEEEALNVREQGIVGRGGQRGEQRRGLVKVNVGVHLTSMPLQPVTDNPD
jgi:hypothetical protein